MKPLLWLTPLCLFACTKAPDQLGSEGIETSSTSSTSTAIEYQEISVASSTLHCATFSAKHFNIELADQAKGPGSQWIDAKAAAQAHQGVLAINAGFFTPEGKPLGLCIDNQSKSGYINKTSLGSGAFVVPKIGPPLLIRRSKIDFFSDAKELLQSGPFLVESGKTIAVKASESRPRSFIAWDGKDQWMIGYVSSITMPDLATFLGSSKIANFNVHTALNLDGGRSSQIYFSDQVSPKEKQLSSLMNRKVRNFIVVKKK